MYILLHARMEDSHTPADFPGKPPKLFNDKPSVEAAIRKLPKTHGWIAYKVVNGKARATREFNHLI